MRSLCRTAILASLILISQTALADLKKSGRITGNIIDLSGSPLQNAIIRIIREVQQGESLSIARSDSRGSFKSVSLVPGIYHLQVSRPGYQPVSTARFAIDEGRTISLDIILQDFIGYISKEDDPRNWDLKTVMRSTSDRRLIFRNMPGSFESDGGGNPAPFYRSGSMSIASNSALDGESYVMGPQSSQSGVSSNFAFTEPVSPRGRMILSGQMDFGSSSFWRVRNTYNFRPDKDHDYRVSVGYGRMNGNYPGAGPISDQFLSQDSDSRESRVQTLAFGMEGSTQLLDLLAVKYGFEYSRLHYGIDRSLFHPSIQILLTPSDKWSLRTSVTSRRASDMNTVVLPDGEILNLSEPALITMIGNRVSMSQVRHSEIAARHTLSPDTNVELAVYQDRTLGPGLPLMLTTNTPLAQQSRVIEMKGNNPIQRGMRLTVAQRISESMGASVAYMYGDASSIVKSDGLMTSAQLEENLANYLHRHYQHSVTGQVEATIPVTKTAVLATVRWNSGTPLTPLDWFSDRMDIGTKSANFEIRQVIPLPEFFGTGGCWEVLIDLRNILNQGREILPASDGELVLNRNPRSLRFGLNLNFR